MPKSNTFTDLMTKEIISTRIDIINELIKFLSSEEQDEKTYEYYLEILLMLYSR
jgi:hypothetical protein